MIIFTQPGYEYLLEHPARPILKKGIFAVERFANKEMHIVLKTPVFNQICLVLGTIAPPEENLVSTAMLAHTLKKEGAAKIIAVLPYMSYTRQDKIEAGKSVAVQWLGETLKASGIDEVWAIDIHSNADIRLLPMKLRSLSPANLFATEIFELKQRGVTVVAPDTGAIKRAQAVSDAAAVTLPICYFHKVRLNGIEHLHMFGYTSEKVVIIDDMLDTGSTLISCVNELRKMGVKQTTIAVSHGLFTGSGWKKLFTLGVDKLYCLDTVLEATKRQEPQIQVIACKQIIGNAIKRLSSQMERQNYALKK